MMGNEMIGPQKKSWLESLLNLTRLETLAWDVAFWICFGDL